MILLLYDCCVNTRHLGHCGRCSEILCERYSRIKDPAISDEQLQRVNMERKEVLIKR